MNLQIQILQPKDVDDLTELISIFAEVFEMENFEHASKAYLQKLLEKENFFAVTAKNDNKIVGGLTVYVLDQYYSPKPLAYIYDVAVLKEYQRKGVGKELLKFTNEYCRQKGFEEVFVQAAKVDEHAIDFYRLNQPTREEHTVQFTFDLKA